MNNIIIGANQNTTSIQEELSKLNENSSYTSSKASSDALLDKNTTFVSETKETPSVSTVDLLNSISNNSNLSNMMSADVSARLNGKSTRLISNNNKPLGSNLSSKASTTAFNNPLCEFSMSDLALDFGGVNIELQIASLMSLLAALFCIDVEDAYGKLEDYLSGDIDDSSVFTRAISSIFTNIDKSNALSILTNISSKDSGKNISKYNNNSETQILSFVGGDIKATTNPENKYSESEGILNIMAPMWKTDNDNNLAPYKVYNSPMIIENARLTTYSSSKTPNLIESDPQDPSNDTVSEDLPDSYYLSITNNLVEPSVVVG